MRCEYPATSSAAITVRRRRGRSMASIFVCRMAQTLPESRRANNDSQEHESDWFGPAQKRNIACILTDSNRVVHSEEEFEIMFRALQRHDDAHHIAHGRYEILTSHDPLRDARLPPL